MKYATNSDYFLQRKSNARRIWQQEIFFAWVISWYFILLITISDRNAIAMELVGLVVFTKRGSDLVSEEYVR